MMKKSWETKAIKHPGRVKEYLKKRYGGEAFLPNGNIRMAYLNRAIREQKGIPIGHRPRGLLSALVLARNLKSFRRR